MNPIDFLKKEHDIIERELVELETIIDEEEVNYSNLIHVFNRLHNLWNAHEEKETNFFILLGKITGNSYEQIKFEHQELRGYKKIIHDTIKSGNESEIKTVFDTDLIMMIDKLRAHLKTENEIIDNVHFEKFSQQEIKELWESIK